MLGEFHREPGLLHFELLVAFVLKRQENSEHGPGAMRNLLQFLAVHRERHFKVAGSKAVVGAAIVAFAKAAVRHVRRPPKGWQRRLAGECQGRRRGQEGQNDLAEKMHKSSIGQNHEQTAIVSLYEIRRLRYRRGLSGALPLDVVLRTVR